jgi:hypothetical protein
MSNFGDRYTPDEKAVITSAANCCHGEPKPQPEYNCPPVCPKCQRCHRGECEPKPQTPHCEDCDPSFTSCWNDGTQCTKNHIIANEFADHQFRSQTPLTYACYIRAEKGEQVDEYGALLRLAFSLERKFQEAECQRDEARNKCNDLREQLVQEEGKQTAMQAERDQLIKVVDLAYVSLEARQRYLPTEGTKQVLEAYHLLPHVVQVKKGIKI